MSLLDASLPRSSTFLDDGAAGLKHNGAVNAAAIIATPVGRDARLDVFRGIALVMIFINHVPGTIFEGLTCRNFGFSDAAEAFVFMSGMASGLAYSSRFRSGPLWPAVVKIWARARQLYFAHLTITMLALAIFAAGALWWNLPELLTKNNISALFQKPLSSLIGIPLLTHQLGYMNILPLYMTLLLATPVLLIVELRRPWLLLGGSVLVWALAGQFRLNFPNFPNAGGWFFNPFSWQLLFVIGLLCGCAMKQGRTFVPYRPALFWVCAAFLVFVLLWMKVPPIGGAANATMGMLSKLGAPFYITWFDKTFLSAPRLLHALALFYVVASLGIMRQFAQSRLASPFRLLGRQGLAVFASGTVISMALQVLKAPHPDDPLFDGLLLAGGLGLQLALAWVLTHTAAMSRAHAPKSVQPRAPDGAHG